MNKAKYKIWTGGYMLKPEDYPLSFPFYVGAFDGKVYQGELEKGEYSLIETSFLALPYIGIQDKNGREIYRGDIVKYDDMGGETHTQVIEYDDEMGAFCCNRGAYADFFLHMWEIEVIGNIYENPELLKDKR